MSAESPSSRRDRRTRRREGRRLGRRDSVHQNRPVEIVRPTGAVEFSAMDVATRWADAVRAGDLPLAMSWYDPASVVHAGGAILVEEMQIQRMLEASGLIGRDDAPIIGHVEPEEDLDGFDITVRWPAAGSEGNDVESRLRIRKGHIVEQWHGEVVRVVPVVGPPLEVSMAGPFTRAEREQVVSGLWQVLDRLGPELQAAALRLERSGDPARSDQVSMKASVLLDHTRLHARGSASTVGAAWAVVEGRLRHQLKSAADRRQALRRRGTSSPGGQWRHGDRPQRHGRSEWLSDDERVVMVRSTWTGSAQHVDEAVEDLDMLDLDALLFREITTDRAAVVWRREEGYVLRFQDGCESGYQPSTQMTPSPAAEVEVDERPFSVMDLQSARMALSLGQPWVVYRDVETEEAGLLYRRNDGHDGLVVLRSQDEDSRTAVVEVRSEASSS